MKKAQGVWQRISRVLRVENIPAPICAMFYKAVVMAVLLYGSELERADGRDGGP